MDFEKWIVDVAINGVKNFSFSKDWAAMQLANHYSRGKITETALQRFDNEIAEYKAEQERLVEEVKNKLMGEIGTTAEKESVNADGQ